MRGSSAIAVLGTPFGNGGPALQGAVLSIQARPGAMEFEPRKIFCPDEKRALLASYLPRPPADDLLRIADYCDIAAGQRLSNTQGSVIPSARFWREEPAFPSPRGESRSLAALGMTQLNVSLYCARLNMAWAFAVKGALACLLITRNSPRTSAVFMTSVAKWCFMSERQAGNS